MKCNTCLIVCLLSALTGVASTAIDKSIANGFLSSEPKEKDEPLVVQMENQIMGWDWHSPEGKNTMTDIQRYRAKVCADIKDEHGKNFRTYDACHKFMKKACQPGSDHSMDGDKPEVTSGKGYCREYFPEEKKDAPKKEKEPEIVVKDVKAGGAAGAPAGSPGPGPAPAAGAPAAGAPVAAAGGASPGPAPSPGPAGSPGPAPVPAPFIPGVSAGKPWGPIADDEAYYYKKGGKDMSRLHMTEAMKLPTQGYWGKLVEHEDMKTSIADWQKEFGPPSHQDSLKAICKQNPDSIWCKRRGFGKNDAFHRHFGFRSSTTTTFFGLLPLLVIAFAL